MEITTGIDNDIHHLRMDNLVWNDGLSRRCRALFRRAEKTCFSCRSFLRKGEVFAYVGRNQNVTDLEDDTQEFSQRVSNRIEAYGLWFLGALYCTGTASHPDLAIAI